MIKLLPKFSLLTKIIKNKYFCEMFDEMLKFVINIVLYLVACYRQSENSLRLYDFWLVNVIAVTRMEIIMCMIRNVLLFSSFHRVACFSYLYVPLFRDFIR